MILVFLLYFQQYFWRQKKIHDIGIAQINIPKIFESDLKFIFSKNVEIGNQKVTFDSTKSPSLTISTDWEYYNSIKDKKYMTFNEIKDDYAAHKFTISPELRVVELALKYGVKL